MKSNKDLGLRKFNKPAPIFTALFLYVCTATEFGFFIHFLETIYITRYQAFKTIILPHKIIIITVIMESLSAII